MSRPHGSGVDQLSPKLLKTPVKQGSQGTTQLVTRQPMRIRCGVISNPLYPVPQAQGPGFVVEGSLEFESPKTLEVATLGEAKAAHQAPIGTQRAQRRQVDPRRLPVIDAKGRVHRWPRLGHPEGRKCLQQSLGAGAGDTNQKNPPGHTHVGRGPATCGPGPFKALAGAGQHMPGRACRESHGWEAKSA